MNDIFPTGRTIFEAVKESTESLRDAIPMANEVVRYCTDDISILYDACLWALPNNQRKHMGLPLKRHQALKRSRKEGVMYGRDEGSSLQCVLSTLQTRKIGR